MNVIGKGSKFREALWVKPCLAGLMWRVGVILISCLWQSKHGSVCAVPPWLTVGFRPTEHLMPNSLLRDKEESLWVWDLSFPDQGSNQRPLHWKVDSLQLDHQERASSGSLKHHAEFRRGIANCETLKTPRQDSIRDGFPFLSCYLFCHRDGS